MEVSEELIKKVMEFEGFMANAYKCPGGVWTIGYGHTRGVLPGQRCDHEQAVEWLKEDLQACGNDVSGLLRGLSRGEYDALTDFVFNLGITNLRNSTLLKKIMINAPENEIRHEFGRWVYAGGKVLNGLVKRRAWEADRYFEK